MNLMKIRAHGMLGVSRIWMEDEVLGSELAAHPLGSAAAGELEVVQGRLANALHQRFQMEQHLTELTERIASAAARFARKGKALHSAFEVLAGFTDDPAEEARYLRLQTLFFPIGLRIFQRSHLEGTGAVEMARKQVTPAILDELSGITLAGRTLADLYNEWLDAGHDLGRCLSERTRTREALRRNGSKAASIDIKAARAEWVRLVRMLFTVADMIRLSDSGRERLQAPLRRAALQAAGASPAADSQTDDAMADTGGEQNPAVSTPEVTEPTEKGSGDGEGSKEAEHIGMSDIQSPQILRRIIPQPSASSVRIPHALASASVSACSGTCKKD